MTSPYETSTPPLDAVLQVATLDDASTVRQLMQEASELKMSQGDDLWGTKPFTDEEVMGMVDTGNLYVCRLGEETAATVLLLPNDERMWGNEQGSDTSAIYIHKLCVGDAFRGQGVGQKVISLAEEIASGQGKTRLRLDCPYDNPQLCAYYERLGFREVRRYDRPLSPGRRNPDKDMFRAALYEKPIE